MTKPLSAFRPVNVVGIGLHPYGKLSETPYVALGLAAVRQALADARIGWSAVESVYHGTTMLGMAPTRIMLRHLGASGIPMTQVENASASGSSAFRQAVLDVASGISEVSLAVGVDKPAIPNLASAKTGIPSLEGSRVAAFTHFALLAEKYVEDTGTSPEDIARVAVKNAKNGARNPYAQRQKAVTLEEITGVPPVAGFFTPLQCCPVGEGAAAVIVGSDDAIARLGIDRRRAVRVLGSVLRTERVYADTGSFDSALTTETVAQTFAETGLSARDLDVIELHDAFTIEEIFYLEAMGLCGRGEAAGLLKQGCFDIGGDVAVSPSGGLLSMGHPLGPTGVGQVAEITRQLRGEAGPRQHEGAKVGLAQMVGLGAVCAVHILRAEN